MREWRSISKTGTPLSSQQTASIYKELTRSAFVRWR